MNGKTKQQTANHVRATAREAEQLRGDCVADRQQTADSRQQTADRRVLKGRTVLSEDAFLGGAEGRVVLDTGLVRPAAAVPGVKALRELRGG